MYFITDWAKRIDFDRMRKDRLERVRQQIETEDFSAIICFRVENIRYLTGLRPGWYPYSQFRYASVVTNDLAPVCMVDEEDYAHRSETMYWLKKEQIKKLTPIIPGQGAQPGITEIVQALQELGVSSGRVGIDLLNLEIMEQLKTALPGIELVNGDECIKRARFIKTVDEIAIMRLSSANVDQGMIAAIRAIEVGKRECEIMGVATEVFCALGMEIAQCQSILASGENLVPLARFVPERVIQNGDLVFMDIGGCFTGMYTEATRTVICGKPNQMQKKIYKTIHTAMKTIEAQVAPGVKSSEVVQAVADLYRNDGFEKYAHLTLLGHGIGLGGSEIPNLSGDTRLTGAEFTFQTGMVLSFEPTLALPGIPGGGAVRIEDEILVTENGCERLTLTPYDDKLLS